MLTAQLHIRERLTTRSVVAGLSLCLLAWLNVGCRPATPRLALEEVATGLTSPTFLTAAPGDTRRLFVLEQHGLIRIIRDGRVQSRAFLDLRDRVGSGEGERGLLGLAFHPDYAENGFFYVNYTNLSHDTHVSRFRVTADPERGDPASEDILLTIPQPFPNHNGGMLAFGPRDGFLYIGTGDGGGANDPMDNAQRLDTLLGKILRVDVDGPFPYAVPPSNPFVGQVGARGEIWAYGLRNPWRFSFDRETGDLWIGDVGQNTREEINFQPASSTGGENYGWKVREGTVCRPGQASCTLPGAVGPIHEYRKVGVRAVTGGYVYRGRDIPRLQGQYLFADYARGNVWSLRETRNGYDELRRTRDLRPRGVVSLISSFGEDATGELYILEYRRGTVYKVIRRLGSLFTRE